MKLYTTPKAISPARVHFFLAEKGVEIPREAVDLGGGKRGPQSFRCSCRWVRARAMCL